MDDKALSKDLWVEVVKRYRSGDGHKDIWGQVEKGVMVRWDYLASIPNSVWWKDNTAHYLNNSMDVVISCCGCVSLQQRLEHITREKEKWMTLITSNSWGKPAARKLSLRRRFTFQHDNDPAEWHSKIHYQWMSLHGLVQTTLHVCAITTKM